MLAMTPRTGSTHLCSALAAASGEFLPPEEMFNPRGAVQNAKFWRNVSLFADYVGTFSKQWGKYFVFKASWHDYQLVSGLTRQMFPDLRVIYIDRLDIVAQGVSFFRALATEVWHRHPDKSKETAAKYNVSKDDVRAKLDVAEISKIIDDLQAERQGWKTFFAAQGIEPLRVSYEGFSDDVEGALRYIGAELGLELNRPIGADIGCVKLADEINEEWGAKVRAFRAAR